MPENRLARTRAAYESTDPMNRLARIYLKHASGLIRDGRAAEAVSAIDEAVRILEPNQEADFLAKMNRTYESVVSNDDCIESTPLTKPYDTDFSGPWRAGETIHVRFPECIVWRGQ